MTVLRASKKTLSWAATWRPSSLPPRSMMSVSTISSVRATNRMAATGILRATSLRASTLARSGRSSDPEQMDNFRQEVHGNGLSSYPHPKLMPEFWQFPTVSMGLGPIGAIYRAKFLKYLEHRGLKDTSKQTVYAFLGDGEMDEPESKGAITIATREKLDNPVFVINCNLQRLDGPVTGNGKIVNELEGIFAGAGWNVIKVMWAVVGMNCCVKTPAVN